MTVKIQKFSKDEVEFTDNMKVKEEVSLQIEFVKGLRTYIDDFVGDNIDYGPQIFGTIISATSATLVSFMKGIAELSEEDTRNILNMMVTEAFKKEGH